MSWNHFTTIFAVLFLAHNGFELWLDLAQGRHLRNRKDRVPKHLAGKVDLKTIRKAVAYNQDKLRLAVFSRFHGAVATWVMVLVGFAWVDGLVGDWRFGGLLSGLLFFGFAGAMGFVWGLPVELAGIFLVEEKHGFNKQTIKGFIVDKLKEILISVVLGGVLLAMLIALMGAGDYWWVYAYAGVTLIQLLVIWIYPVAIMPLFNKFSPVDPQLAGEVAGLSSRVGFPLAAVQAMDGSRRSAHSNAFFVGLWGARRIVLYDTLIEKLGRSELLAVLAHELGHFKLGHIRRRLALVLTSLLGLFAALAWVREQPGAYAGLGFAGPSDHAALVVFMLLVTEALAPAGWLLRVLGRRDEHAADRFAVDAVGNGADLSAALVGLTKQNLASPGSHRLYRAYYNSHPALRLRLEEIKRHAKQRGLPMEPGVPSDSGEVDCASAPEGGDGVDERDGPGEHDAGLAEGQS